MSESANEPLPHAPQVKKGSDRERNKLDVKEQRAKYLDGKLTHQEYYLWLSDFLGLSDRLIPATEAEVKASTDPHLNGIPLLRWDRMDSFVRTYATGLSWSLSDTVCCLKAMARRRTSK